MTESVSWAEQLGQVHMEFSVAAKERMGFALMIGQVDMNSVRGTVAAMLGR